VANLYLINKTYGENGLNLAKLDADAKVGLIDRLHEDMELIDYGQLVDLIIQNKVINFA
jgi:hypothetical protein